ncbi:MAG: calcium/sodium antiporter [Candidatus Glassbacteria bacterium]
MTLKLLLFVAGIFFLYFGADWFVKGSSRIAAILKVTPLVIGLTVVAFGTSAPELVVSIIASFKNEPDITLGNVIGSNIANIGLVLGISALIARLNCQVRTIRREIPMMILSSILLLVLAIDGEISASNGILLILGIILFILYSYKSMSDERALIPEEVREEYKKLTKPKEDKIGHVIMLSALGLGLLLLGAHLIIDSAVYLADELGVSRKIIALSMVAVGTSLPELATSAVAVKRGEHDISIGNIIGSSIFNLLCVIGVIATISPIRVSGNFTWDFLVMLVMSVILIPMIGSKSSIARYEGALLLILYSVYIGWLASQI